MPTPSFFNYMFLLLFLLFFFSRDIMSIYNEPPPGMCIVPDKDDITKVSFLYLWWPLNTEPFVLDNQEHLMQFCTSILKLKFNELFQNVEENSPDSQGPSVWFRATEIANLVNLKLDYKKRIITQPEVTKFQQRNFLTSSTWDARVTLGSCLVGLLCFSSA